MKNRFAIYINLTLLFSTVAMAVVHEIEQYSIDSQLKLKQFESASQPRVHQQLDSATLAVIAAKNNQGLSQSKPKALMGTAQYKQHFPASDQAEIHAVGVYKADIPNEVVWWQKCGDMSPHQCHRAYASQHEEGAIQVNVSYSKKPIILTLMAYEPVHWVIQQSSGSQIEAVILGGYHGQRVSGISSSIPVSAYTYDTSNCGACSKGNGYFYGYELKAGDNDFAQKIFDITGKRLSTLQGSHKGSSFSINDYTPKLDFQRVATP